MEDAATTIFPVSSEIDGIDLGLLGLDRYGATYVVRGSEGAALIELGTSMTVPRLLAGLAALGVTREAVTHLLLTHVHMDHAGAVGHLLAHLPRAQVVIHSRSHRHLADPTRLRAGVEAAVRELFPLYGEIEPVDPTRLLPGESLDLDLGGRVRLEALPTPGHSPDHLAYFAPVQGVLFTGDAAGVSLFAHQWLRPVTAPPAFDLEASLQSIEKMRQLRPLTLAFTHFGLRGDPEVVFDRLEEMLCRWDEWMRSRPREEAEQDIWAELQPPSEVQAADIYYHFAEMNRRGWLASYEQG